MNQLQLANWIPSQHMIVSQATGFQKPEKEIFQLAEERFNLTAEETLYVGDNYDNDVLGAKELVGKRFGLTIVNEKLMVH